MQMVQSYFIKQKKIWVSDLLRDVTDISSSRLIFQPFATVYILPKEKTLVLDLIDKEEMNKGKSGKANQRY